MSRNRVSKNEVNNFRFIITLNVIRGHKHKTNSLSASQASRRPEKQGCSLPAYRMARVILVCFGTKDY